MKVITLVLAVVLTASMCVSLAASNDESSLSGTQKGGNHNGTKTESRNKHGKDLKKGNKRRKSKKRGRSTVGPTTDAYLGDSTTPPMYICYSDEQRQLVESIMMGYVMESKIDMWSAFSIKMAPDDQKKKLILDLLEEAGLPPLPKCLNVTTGTPMDDLRTTARFVLEDNDSVTTVATVKVDEMIDTPATKDASIPPSSLDQCVQRIVSHERGLEIIEKMSASLNGKSLHITDLSSKAARRKLRQFMQEEDSFLCDSFFEALNTVVKEESKIKNVSLPPAFANMSPEQMKAGLKQLQKAIKDGFLPEDTMQKIQTQEITVEWLVKNLTSNKEFIYSQLPPKMQVFARQGKIDDKYFKIFASGKSRSEIEEALISDDSFFLQFFPDIMADAIIEKGVGLPVWLKEAMVKGGPESANLQDTLFDNVTWCNDLFGDETTCVFLSLYKNPRKLNLSNALNYLIYVLLVFIMLAMGLTIEYAKIKELVKRPKGVAIAFVAQFGFMPAAAFGLAKLFNLQSYSALTILLVGCSPGGNISNLLAYAFDGDMNLSILMTCCSCVVGLGMMPVNIFIWSHLVISDSDMMIPYTKICISIAITLIPVAIGSFIRNRKPKWVDGTRKIGFIMVFLVAVVVSVIAGYLFGDILIKNFPVDLIYACAILPILGYVFGFFLSLILGESYRSCRTIMIETGCQNSQLCAGILKLSFNPITVGIYFLVPMVYMFMQVIEAVLMIVLWKIFCRGTQSKYEVADEFDEEMKSLNGKESPPSDSVDFKMGLKKPVDNRASVLHDISDVWPLQGQPSQSCINSFKQAKTENFV